MLAHAAAWGIDVFVGTAEELSFADSCFDDALLVTTLYFLDSPEKALLEARRVLKPRGRLVIGFIDRASEIGWDYEAHKAENVFCRDATFHSGDEVERLLQDAGFSPHVWAQTLTRPLAESADFEPVAWAVPWRVRRCLGAQRQVICRRALSPCGRIAA